MELFRYETRILGRLPPAPYRPGLLATYDRDGWAALLLEHVEGRHPDLGATLGHRAAANLVAAQVAELTPPPAADATPLAESARRWARRWSTIAADPAGYLPAWAAARTDEMLARARRLPDRLPAQTLCHFDVRDDNPLVRPDGTAAILDWGMARLGPSWADPLLLALQNSTDTTVRVVSTLTPTEHEAAVDLITALAGSQAWNARQPAPPPSPPPRLLRRRRDPPPRRRQGLVLAAAPLPDCPRRTLPGAPGPGRTPCGPLTRRLLTPRNQAAPSAEAEPYGSS